MELYEPTRWWRRPPIDCSVGALRAVHGAYWLEVQWNLRLRGDPLVTSTQWVSEFENFEFRKKQHWNQRRRSFTKIFNQKLVAFVFKFKRKLDKNSRDQSYFTTAPESEQNGGIGYGEQWVRPWRSDRHNGDSQLQRMRFRSPEPRQPLPQNHLTRNCRPHRKNAPTKSLHPKNVIKKT